MTHCRNHKACRDKQSRVGICRYSVQWFMVEVEYEQSKSVLYVCVEYVQGKNPGTRSTSAQAKEEIEKARPERILLESEIPKANFWQDCFGSQINQKKVDKSGDRVVEVELGKESSKNQVIR